MSASGIFGIVFGSIAAIAAMLGGLWLSRKLRSVSVYNLHQDEEQALTEMAGGDSGGAAHPEVLPGIPLPAIEIAETADENPFTFSKSTRPSKLKTGI